MKQKKVKWVKGYYHDTYYGMYHGYKLFDLYYRDEWKNWGMTFLGIKWTFDATTYTIQKHRANVVLNKFLKAMIRK